ncbi:hypothetical protein TEA_005118 [Camellia sinensis var. sinensis]|uniref:Bet v I/Major latex protein domain-containing protein n=1 Tax=Camellia sinensis var. sinensis TaxID=542762 RepID=A0A4S4ERK6_CAMSN|nr:hypothetical protein TEA_005118 [Camellia sinensis var. sinensis]
MFICSPSYSPNAPKFVIIHDLYGGICPLLSLENLPISPNGKKKVIKEVIEAIDEENKSVTFKVIGGDVTELYRTFKITVHVDTKGENNLVTWTFEYEKKSEDVEDPNTLMDFAINVSKDIESHHLKS